MGLTQSPSGNPDITVTTTAQPNITSLGTLASLNVGGAVIVTGSTPPDFQRNNGATVTALRLSNLTAGGQGSALEWFTGFGSKVVGKAYSEASGSAGATFTVQTLRQATGTLTNTIASDNTGAVTFAGPSITALHLVGGSSAPTIANGAGAGTSPGTPAITGTDAAGQITIITGTLPAVSAVAVTITFNAAYASAPYVVIWPANAAAATLGFLPYVGSTTSTFTVNTGTIALGVSTTYLYNFHVMQ